MVNIWIFLNRGIPDYPPLALAESEPCCLSQTITYSTTLEIHLQQSEIAENNEEAQESKLCTSAVCDLQNSAVKQHAIKTSGKITG